MSETPYLCHNIWPNLFFKIELNSHSKIQDGAAVQRMTVSAVVTPSFLQIEKCYLYNLTPTYFEETIEASIFPNL